ITLRPVFVEPVNMIMSTASISASPVAPRPVATWKTSSGTPDARSPAASRRLVSGVSSLGLRITLLPAASAGMQSPNECQRVVPGPDHAHEPERPVAEHEPLARDEDRRRADLLVGQVLGRVLGPEPERAGAVGELGGLGVLPRLARLGHDRVDHAVAVFGQPALGAAQDAPAALEAERLPGGLRGAAAAGEVGDLLAPEVGDVADDLPGGRVLDRDVPRRAVRARGRLLLHARHRVRSLVSALTACRTVVNRAARPGAIPWADEPPRAVEDHRRRAAE